MNDITISFGRPSDHSLEPGTTDTYIMANFALDQLGEPIKFEG
jgi:hypothetical protein